MSTGSSDQVISSRETEDCSVTSLGGIISAMCSFSRSSVTGFQMIVQMDNITEVHKLLINDTTGHLSTGPVTVQVEENKTYHVAIFLIMGEKGIVNGTLVYSRVLSVNGMLAIKLVYWYIRTYLMCIIHCFLLCLWYCVTSVIQTQWDWH